MLMVDNLKNNNMKTIELTEEQKANLLEMCKILFPDDYFSFFNDLGDDGILDRNMIVNNPFPYYIDETYTIRNPKSEYFEEFYNGKPRKKLSWDNEGSHFHWFEFCMTHLMYKLSYEFSKIPNSKGKPIHLELWSLNKGDYFTKHPVDYLYEEFLKLKK